MATEARFFAALSSDALRRSGENREVIRGQVLRDPNCIETKPDDGPDSRGMSMDAVRDDEFVKALVECQGDISGFIATLLMLPSWHDVEDILQQTSLILWQKRAQFDGSRDFLRWACGIARNEVRNFQRRQAARRMVFSEELINSLAVVRLDAQPLLEKRRAMLAACAEKLDSTARKLFECCYSGACTIQSVARQFHLSPNAVYLRLRRIRRELMECIEEGMEEGDAT